MHKDVHDGIIYTGKLETPVIPCGGLVRRGSRVMQPPPTVMGANASSCTTHRKCSVVATNIVTAVVAVYPGNMGSSAGRVPLCSLRAL